MSVNILSEASSIYRNKIIFNFERFPFHSTATQFVFLIVKTVWPNSSREAIVIGRLGEISPILAYC